MIFATAAWLAVLPCAAATLALVVLLGPALGPALSPSDHVHFWPRLNFVRPEPVEQARYLLALLAPLLLAAAIALGTHTTRLRLPAAKGWVTAIQVLLVGFLATNLVIQHTQTYSGIYFAEETYHPHHTYFTWVTLGTAVLLAALAAAALRRRALMDRIEMWTRDTHVRAGIAIGIAVLATVAWSLTAINTDNSLREVNPAVRVNIAFWTDESFAVLTGTPPLVGFHAQYSQLWPYLAAGVMKLLGSSVLVFSTTMASLTGAAMLAIFATLRRVAGRWLYALALYLPFLATSFFLARGPLDNRFAPSSALSIFPMRYAGPYLLAWLLARKLGGSHPRHSVLVFLAAGIVAINNPEFGIPALGATLAALLWTASPFTPRRVGHVLASAALGIAGAMALVALLTLTVGGGLPHFSMLFTFSRLFGLQGFSMLPMRPAGFTLVVYVTFVAAIGVATVRAFAHARDTVLTGLLTWSGIFGLGAGGYFVGRSHPEVLILLFSTWALAVVLLTVVVVRSIASRTSRLPTPAEAAVLVGFAIALCSLPQIPTPWSQIARLQPPERPVVGYTPIDDYLANQGFVAAHTRPGDRVGIITLLGHRIAYDLGLKNVAPYADLDSMPTIQQWDETIRIFHREGVREVFVGGIFLGQEQVAALESAGYRRKSIDPRTGLLEMRRRA